jgi:hypothetical protein
MCLRISASTEREGDAIMSIKEELERARSDALYFESRRPELLHRYPNHWVAVYDKQVVGTAKELPILLTQIDNRGVPRDRVFIEYLTTDDTPLVVRTT